MFNLSKSFLNTTFKLESILTLINVTSLLLFISFTPPFKTQVLCPYFPYFFDFSCSHF